MASALHSPGGGSRGVVMVDVARLAGVSQKTVSRVVNGAPHVRPDVRERVNRAIEELGYRPNVAAQALARERSHTIGVLALGTRFFGPSRRVFTLEHEARRLGYTMALTSVPDLSARSVADGIDTLLKRGVEGLVVEVPTHLINIDPAQLAGLPVVTSAGWIPGVPRQAVVDIDQEEACRKLTRYLLGLGHRTVWHVAGPRDWDAAQKRLAQLAFSPARCWFACTAGVLRRLVGRVRLRTRPQAGSPRRCHRDLRRQRPDGNGDPTSASRGGPGDPRRRIGRRLRRCSGGRIPDGAVDHGWR